MKVLLLYPRLQFRAQDIVKPDGSLALPYLAGELRRRGHEVRIFDCSTGHTGEGFDRRITQPNGMVLVGVSDDAILEEAAWADVVGITSIFTQQTTPVLEMVRLISRHRPVALGGVNARSLASRFLEAGATKIFKSEADFTFPDWCEGLDSERIPEDLDELALPAWDLLPNGAYWKIARPHGGDFVPNGLPLRYASMMTSRGCPFACSYCHISREQPGDEAGNIGKLRLKSVSRVLEEAQTLKDLGVEWLFLEDDSLLARKARIITIFEGLSRLGLRLADVNGVNLAHFQRRGPTGRLEIDLDLLDAMKSAGFEKLTLPFESASQRILDKWASRKWKVADLDAPTLIRACQDRGIATFGNYMIGYPDETFSEMQQTIEMAQGHVAQGLTAASFFVTVPFPGSAMFDIAIRDGHLSPDFDPDAMSWTRSIFKNTPVHADAIEMIRTLAWQLVNRPAFTQSRQAMTVSAA